MDAEGVADPPVNPSTNEDTAETMPLHVIGDEPLSEPQWSLCFLPLRRHDKPP